MATYAISGVWKDNTGTITHYAIHTVNGNTLGLATKYTKANAINLLDNNQNSARTLLWNYTDQNWQWGTTVQVVGAGVNRYLRTTQDGTVRDNLAHLINYGWVTNNFA
ncbi:DUF3892 domain-containing protein [Chryseobacterium gambrini]|uniref:DUF3892 domain-containing protein n=1 Tax=Chryseobacterium gambrini TaxID=373672 RepID=UPI003D0EF0AC